MPALAARVEPIYELMYMISPTIAQFFMPVQKSDEDNGVKMEVVSAHIHDNVAEIYIIMQDLTKSRIDETTDLFDSYSINRPFDSSSHCESVGYDKNTKTATFLITIDEWGNKDIAGYTLHGDFVTSGMESHISFRAPKRIGLFVQLICVSLFYLGVMIIMHNIYFLLYP